MNFWKATNSLGTAKSNKQTTVSYTFLNLDSNLPKTEQNVTEKKQ